MTERLCRICRQGSSEGDLCHPCRCAGSIRFVHQACLDRWLSRKQTTHCELCGAEFRYVKNIVSSAPKILPIREFSGYLWEYYRRGRSHLLRLLFVNFTWGLLLPISVTFGCRFLLYGLYPPHPFFVHILDLPKSICLGLLAAIGGVVVFLLQSFIHAAIAEVFRVFLWWRQRSTLTTVAAQSAASIDPPRSELRSGGIPLASSVVRPASGSSIDTARVVLQSETDRSSWSLGPGAESRSSGSADVEQDPPQDAGRIEPYEDSACESKDAMRSSLLSEDGEENRHDSNTLRNVEAMQLHGEGSLAHDDSDEPSQSDSIAPGDLSSIDSIGRKKNRHGQLVVQERDESVCNPSTRITDVSPLVVATGDEHLNPAERISVNLRFPLHPHIPSMPSTHSIPSDDVPSEEVQVQTLQAPTSQQSARLATSIEDATVDENGADAELLMWAGLAGPPHRSLICIGFVWLGSMLFLLIFLLLPYKMGETLLYHDVSRAISMHTDLRQVIPSSLTHMRSTLKQQILYQCTPIRQVENELIFNLSSAVCPGEKQFPNDPYVLTRPAGWTMFHLSSARSASAWMHFVSRLHTDVFAHMLKRYRPPVASVAWTPVAMTPGITESVDLFETYSEMPEGRSSYTAFKSPWGTFYPNNDLALKVAKLPTINIDLQDSIGLNWYAVFLNRILSPDEYKEVDKSQHSLSTEAEEALKLKLNELTKLVTPIPPPTLWGDIADAHWYATARQPLRPWRESPFLSDSTTVPAYTLVPPTARSFAKRPSVAVLGQGQVQLTFVGDSFGCSVPYWILGRLVLKDVDYSSNRFSRNLKFLTSPFSSAIAAHQQSAQISYQVKFVLAPLPSPSTSLKWVLVAWWAGLMGQAQVIKAALIGSAVIITILCLVMPPRAKLGDLSLRRRWASRNILLRTLAKWMYLLLDLTHFALSFLEIGYKIFVVIFCKVAVPFSVGFCLIRLGSVSPWLGLDSRWVSFHIHSNAQVVILFAHLLGWIHTFCVASVTLRVLDTLELTVTEKIIMHDKITLSFFTFNFAVLASLTDIKQMLLSSSRETSERLTEELDEHEQSSTYQSTDFVWQVTDLPLEDLNDDLISKIYRLMGAYFSTASWNDFLEGLLVFLFIHVLVAALSAWATASVVQLIAPQLLPFQMMPTVSSPQALQRPWLSAFSRMLLSAKCLIWDFDIESSQSIMPLMTLFLRCLILTACWVFWYKCIWWLEPPPRLHALTPLTLLALRIGGFAEYVKSEFKTQAVGPPVVSPVVSASTATRPPIDQEASAPETEQDGLVMTNTAELDVTAPLCILRGPTHRALPSEWRRRELAFVICKEVEALFISNDDLVALDYKHNGQTFKYDCVSNVDRSQFVVSGVFVASRVETVNSSGDTNEEDIMFKVYMPSAEVPNASLSNIRFAASKIFVVQEDCICRSYDSDAVGEIIKFPLKARGFFMGDGDGTHYTFRYVAVQAPNETHRPLPIWRPLPGTWRFPCCPAILLCTAVTIVVCCVLTFPLAIGRLLFCILHGRSWTITTGAVGPTIVQSFASFTPVESTIHHGLAAVPAEIMEIPIPTTEHTDLVTYALGCLCLWGFSRVAYELSSETSWANVLYQYIQRHPGGWKSRIVHIGRLIAFAFGILVTLVVIPCIQGAVIDLTVVRPEITAISHPLHMKETRALFQCHVQWFIIGLIPAAAWLFLLYLTHFGMWIHPTPYIGSAVVSTDVLQELSATVLEFRWTSRGVATDARKIKILYGSLLTPLLKDLSAIILRPILVSMILHSLILRYKIPLYPWLMGILVRPVGALIAFKFSAKAVSQAWREIATLHSTVWQNRYVISTILCNSESD